MDERLERFVRQMPKVELHLHLEGTVRPATLLDLARHHGIALPAQDADGLSRWYRFRGFRHFLDVWLTVLGSLRTEAEWRALYAAAGLRVASITPISARSVECIIEGIPA